MRRRLDLAASLVGRPSVIFLDEPTTGLDPAKREDMWEVVRSLVADGLDRAAHHPVPRRGRRAGRRDQRHRPRPGDRPRHPGRAQADRRRPADRGPARPTRPGSTTSAGSCAEVSGAHPQLDRPRRAHRPGVRRGRARRRPSTGCATPDISVHELSLHLPSLDEVFLTLTGRTETDRLPRRTQHDHHRPPHPLRPQRADGRRRRRGTRTAGAAGTSSRWPSAA